MINERVAALLIDQVGSELSAHQTYFGISLYFDRRSLAKWARLFRRQSVEEAEHASKIIGFLIDHDIAFDLPAIGSAATTYASPADSVRAALESELRVTGQFNVLAGAATAASDHRSLQFLQWFIDEQVEEERSMRRLLDLVESGINLFQAEALLEDEE